MQEVSNKYKDIMSKPIRNRAYASVSLGVINQTAQGDSSILNNNSDWSDEITALSSRTDTLTEYATMEQNFFSMDGSKFFIPPNDNYISFRPVVSSDIRGSITISFSQPYNIKGLTINFGKYYPTRFKITTNNYIKTFDNVNSEFVADIFLEDTEYITIQAIEMIGGNQRLRINKVLMGIGLVFDNSSIKNISLVDNVNAISEELPYKEISVSILDVNSSFDVDLVSSAVNFLEQGQELNFSIGVEIDNNSKEWIQMSKLYLTNWDSSKGEMHFTAKDKFSFMNDIYVGGNYIHERSLYDDALEIMLDLGLELDEFEIDDCLRGTKITNPLPELTHAELLQLIANAGRCRLYQDRNGVICLKANFVTVIDPEDYVVEVNSSAKWSKPQNIMSADVIKYADYSKNMFSLGGNNYFIPVDENYLNTSYVSAEISNFDGLFDVTPTISIKTPMEYLFYGLQIKFGGCPPKRIKISSYNKGVLEYQKEFENLEIDSYLKYESRYFDNLTIEILETAPNARAVIDSIIFGDVSDFALRKQAILNSKGYRESKIKNVNVRIFSFIEEIDEDDNVTIVESELKEYVTHEINNIGECVVFENPLIGDYEHAQMVADWLANYYANDISYDISFNGEPRLDAGDIIYVESDYYNNLQCEIEESNLSFNGSFKGQLKLRKATSNIVENIF